MTVINDQPCSPLGALSSALMRLFLPSLTGPVQQNGAQILICAPQTGWSCQAGLANEQEELFRLAQLSFPLLNQRGAEGSLGFLPVVLNFLALQGRRASGTLKNCPVSTQTEAKSSLTSMSILKINSAARKSSPGSQVINFRKNHGGSSAL